jgi:hypothetical protein
MTIYETLIKDRDSSVNLQKILKKFNIDHKEIEKHIKEKISEKRET